MLIVFKSKAAGDVMMFGDVAQSLMEIMGKDPGDKGIVTVEQMPDAIARLKAAVAQDKAEKPIVDHDERIFEKTPEGGKREYVSLARRAVPLIELLEYSLKEGEPVVWGV
jgi:RNA-splicing ligase RtcB